MKKRGTEFCAALMVLFIPRTYIVFKSIFLSGAACTKHGTAAQKNSLLNNQVFVTTTDAAHIADDPAVTAPLHQIPRIGQSVKRILRTLAIVADHTARPINLSQYLRPELLLIDDLL